MRKSRTAPWNLDYFINRSIPEPNSGCWIWLGAATPHGYGAVRINGRTTRPHRAVYEIVHKQTLPSNIDVCHICDVRLCVNPDHLFIGSRKDNMNDCINKGRFQFLGIHRKGEKSPSAKLTAKQVLEIRSDNRSSRKLAAVYGVTKGTILNIRHHKTWSGL